MYFIDVLLCVVVVQAAAIAALIMRGMRRARAERVLRESEERFRLIADSAPVMIWTARVDTTLDYLNRNCIEFTELPNEKLRDEGWLDAAIGH
jgi:PAS domain-containing protein